MVMLLARIAFNPRATWLTLWQSVLVAPQERSGHARHTAARAPGRSPGFVKPDGVAFGGSDDEPFRVYSPFLAGVAGVQGTSYAAPLVLRAAAGIQALIDTKLDAISLKALLVHNVDPAANRPRAEVGWGRFRENPVELLECGSSSATIIFRDTLAKGEYRRCPIPFPDVTLGGKAKIKATLCIAAQTDPEHTINYTRSGMGITFRPRIGIGEDRSTEFFGIGSQYKAPERELHDAAHKWETILHRDRKFEEIGALAGPVFDVEYHARAQSRGVTPASAPDVSFALVVTLRATQQRPDGKFLTDLRFHDLRHEATSSLASIFPMHELTKITGHKDPRMLMRYYPLGPRILQRGCRKRTNSLPGKKGTQGTPQVMLAAGTLFSVRLGNLPLAQVVRKLRFWQPLSKMLGLPCSAQLDWADAKR